MNILLSGGSGYIGNFLVKELLNAGHQVSIISRSENEFTREYGHQIKIYNADITLPIVFHVDRQYDIFIHLAAANDIDSADPSKALSISTLGTRYALDFCKRNGIRKFVYYSTFQVIGDVSGNIDDNTAPKPLNDYGITHLFAEEYVQMYQRLGVIEGLIIRPTNIYGAPMYKSTDRWTLVPSCLCKEAYDTGTITLKSSGKQVRDFLDIQDLVKVTLYYCNNFDSYANRVINLSSGNKFSVIEIATTVKIVYEKMFGKPCGLNVLSENPATENSFYICRNTLEKSGYKYKPKQSLVTEIEKIFDLLGEA